MKIQNPVAKFLSSLLIFFVPLGLSAQDLQQRADSLFAANQYAKAFTYYDSLMQSGQTSPAILLRMAYISEGQDRISRALYYLNQYYSLTGDYEVRNKMLRMAEKNELQGYGLSDLDYLRALLLQYRTSLVLTLCLSIFILFGLIVYKKRKLQQRPMLSGMLMVALLGMLFYFNNFDPKGSRGIVWQENTYLMQGPSAGAGLHSILPAGHRLEILGEEDVWLRVRWQDEILYVKRFALRQV